MNKQNAHLYTPLVQALAKGKTIEILVNSNGCEDWEEAVELDFSCAPDCYRIKPEPVTEPLGPEDVPPGSAIRSIGDTQWWMVSSVAKTHVNLGHKGWSTYEALQKCSEIKRPGEDWMPCHKPSTTNQKP
jgi:hypothetical protein